MPVLWDIRLYPEPMHLAATTSPALRRNDVTRSPSRRKLRSIGLLAAVVVMIALPPIGVGDAAPVGDGHRVDPISVRGRARLTPAMRKAAPAGFRDLGPGLGLRRAVSSYSVVVRDVDDDGWIDLLIGHHGHRAELFLNRHDGATWSGLEVVASFYDTIHDRRDRHGCTIDDVDLDGLDDIFCAKGAQSGTAKKWNELWMQGPGNTWTDRAHAYGVEDHWGRGRFPMFMDLNHDPYPDLFIGNDIPRKDDRRSPNRTFINLGGQRFEEVKLGVTRELGDTCTDVADYDDDGREDLLLCGRYRLYLFRRRPKSFTDVRERVKLPWVKATAARFADLDDDGQLDLVYATRERLEVRLQRRDHTFGRVVARHALLHAHGLATGDPDGDGDTDIYVVEGCVGRVNQDDWLLVNAGTGRRFVRRRVEPVSRGCGDTAAAADFDRDGRDEFVVVNGGGREQPLDLDGPDQVLTMGDWKP
jgi:FG-GAP-like repeat